MSATLKKMVAECRVPENLQGKNAGVFLTHTEDMPVSADDYWSAFRNFKELQYHLEGQYNPYFLEGDTVVSFEYHPVDFIRGQRYQKLVKKDDSTRTWTIEEFQENRLYKSYQMTIKVKEAEAAQVTISVRFVSAIENAKKRRDDIAFHMVHLLGARIRDILDFVVREKFGGKHRVELTVNCPRQKLWSTVGNFEDISWMRDSIHTVLVGDRRMVFFTGNRSLEVRLAWANDSEHVFVYEADNSPDFLRCKYYRGKLKFFADGAYKVKVVYDCSYLPARGESPHAFGQWMAPNARDRIEWLKIFLRPHDNKASFDEDPPSYWDYVTSARDNVMSLYGKIRGAVWPGGQAQRAIEPAAEDSPTMKYSTTCRGKVMGSVEDVWKVFRPFGEQCMEYWTIYDSMAIEEPGIDEVGCVRTFVTSESKTKFRERLEYRDDVNHAEIYSLMSMEPPAGISFAYTTVRMTAVGEKKETEVQFECTFETSNPSNAGSIQKHQKEAYKSCIDGLKEQFLSDEGKLEVTVESAQNLSQLDVWFSRTPYVITAVNDGKPESRKADNKSTTDFVWKEDHPLELPLTSRSTNVMFTIMNQNSMSQDSMLGMATVNLSELQPNDEVKMPLDVQGGGTLNVRLCRKMHDASKKKEKKDKVLKAITLPFMIPVFLSELHDIRDEFSNLIKSFVGTGQKYELRPMSRLKSHPDVALEELPAACVPMPSPQMFSPNKVGQLSQRLAEFIGSQGQIMVRLAQVKGIWDPWKVNFSGYLPTNERLIAEWENDEEFCRQFLQGINPMMVKVCNNMDQVPNEMRNLRGQGKTVQQLMKDNRLFIIDYEPMLSVPNTPGKFFYAPIVLMYSDKSARMNILGIQLTRNEKGKNEVYSPESATKAPNKYMFAKMHVMSADNNVHQFLYHLGYTHLAMEPIAVSLHTHLPPDHPIHRLLLPHFKDTIGINYLARHSLVSRIFPITDPMFATSTVGGLMMFIEEWNKYNFMDMAFPEELKRRGFDESRSDGLENYFYRDDGFKLWNIYKNYVQGVVDMAYASDKTVADDKALQEFCKMIEGPGKIHGFPRQISTKTLLVDCLTNIIFNVSAQHSAVNFPQYDYYSFVPNRPAQLKMGMPDGPDDMPQSDILKALPDPLYTTLQVLLSYILSMPSQTAITGVEAMKDVYPEVHDEFNKQLRDLSMKIKERNGQLKAKGKAAYAYLDPDNVAMSVDI